MIPRYVRTAGCALLLICSGVPLDARAGTFIAGDDLTRLMMPYLKVDAADHGKLVPRFLERGKMVIPSPALFVFFSPAGCMTAAVERTRLAADDGRCMRGDGLADRNAFAMASGLSRTDFEGKPALFVFSPVFDLARLLAVLPADQADKLAADREQLEALVSEWRTQNPGSLVKQVAVRFQ